MWTDDWVGLPHEPLGRGPDAYDCLGLFLALQRERHGRALFDPLCRIDEAARARLSNRYRPEWQRVGAAVEGAAVLFLVRGQALHVGYALGPNLMLHSSGEAGQSIVEDFTSSAWGARLEGIYVYRD